MLKRLEDDLRQRATGDEAMQTALRREQASERQMQYFQRHPTDSDRDYFYDVFRTAQTLPTVAGLFDDSHNSIWVYGISGDAAKELIDFW